MKLLRKLTIKNLKLNRKRTIVTIVGIMLSVALLTAVIAVYASFMASVTAYLKCQEGDYHLSIKGVEKKDTVRLSKNRNVENLSMTYELGYADFAASQSDDRPYVYVEAYSKEALKRLLSGVIEGRLPENETEILVPEHIENYADVSLEKAGLGIGDTVKLQIGRRMKDGEELTQDHPYQWGEEETIEDTVERTYQVVGIMKRPSIAQEPYTAPGFLLITCAGEELEAQKTGMRTNVYMRYTKTGLQNPYGTTANILGIDTAILKQALSSRWQFDGEKEAGMLSYDWDMNLDLIALEGNWLKNPLMRGGLTVIAIVCAVIVLTAVFCIKNSFDISITEKIRQYGMLAGIGATKRQIRCNVLYEAGVLGSLGIPLGVAAGLSAAKVLMRLTMYYLKGILEEDFQLRFAFSWWGVIFAIVLGLITIYFSAVRSAGRAAKISPITAVRNSADIRIKAKKLKTPWYVKKLLGIGGELAYKNWKRNKRKYRTTTLSLTVSVWMLIAVWYGMDVIYNNIKSVYQTKSYNVSLLLLGEDESSADGEEPLTVNTGEQEETLRQILNLNGKDRYACIDGFSLYTSNIRYQKEYVKKVYFDSYRDGQEQIIDVRAVGEEEYARYLKRLGLRYEDVWNQYILINSVEVFTMEKGNLKTLYLPVYDLKKGDTIAGKAEQIRSAEDNAGSVTDEAVLPMNNAADVTEDSREIWDYDDLRIFTALEEITVACVTEKRPMGIDENRNWPVLIISDAYLRQLQEKSDLMLRSDDGLEVFFQSHTPYELEKGLKDLFRHHRYCYINNLSREVKEAENLFRIVGIFLYGFILVISLIGFTSVFNTITTAMELRKPELAILQSVGMTKKEFNRMLRLESLFMGAKSLFFGSTSGILLSYVMYRYMKKGFMWELHYEPPLKAVMVSVTAVFLLIFCTMKYAVGRLDGQNIIETIRNENI